MKKYIYIIFTLFIVTSFLNGITVYVGPARTYTTLHDAINAFPAGTVLDLIVDPGIYTDNIDDPTKRISITGSGSGGNSLVDTIISKSADATIIKINISGTPSERVIFRNFRIVPEGVYAFEFPDTSSVSDILFDNVTVTGSPSTAGENEIGIKVSTTADVDKIEITDCTFSYLDYALYFAKHGDWGPSTSNVTNFTMRNCSIVNNDYKGAYIEKLSDALFENVTLYSNGLTAFWNSRWNAGIDINLKGDNYQNITFTGCVFTNNALGFQEGAALMIKARDDGATYGAHPATLSNIVIFDCEFRDNERGIRFGESNRNNAGPSNVTIRNSIISGNEKTYSANDGSEYGGIINYTRTQTDARYNYWDIICSGPYHLTINPAGQGDTVYGDVIFTPWRCYSSPVAVINTDPDPPNGLTPFFVRFDGTRSNDTVNSIISYRWDFGDGHSDLGSIATHIYNRSGNFRVTLTVTNSLGIEDSTSTVVRSIKIGEISAKIWTELPRIKANGKQTTMIFAELYTGGSKLRDRYKILFNTDLGKTEEDINFDNASARYSQILRSGIPGTDMIKLFLENNYVAEIPIDYIWIQPPASFNINVYGDSKLFVKHFIAILNWSPPAIIYNEIKLKEYRIYRSFDGNSWEIIAGHLPSIHKLTDSINKLPVRYRIFSLDKDGNESSKLEVKWE